MTGWPSSAAVGTHSSLYFILLPKITLIFFFQTFYSLFCVCINATELCFSLLEENTKFQHFKSLYNFLRNFCMLRRLKYFPPAWDCWLFSFRWQVPTLSGVQFLILFLFFFNFAHSKLITRLMTNKRNNFQV